MRCPHCNKPLVARTSQGLQAFVCQDHGVWQDWASAHELIRRSRGEANDTETALLEGFLWGRLI